MNVHPDDSDHGHIPEWHHDTLDEDAASRSSRWRILAGVGAVIVVAVMLLIPVLQATILQRQRNALPEAAVTRTALLFSSAVLLGRSEGQALIFTADEGREDVRRVLRALFEQSQPSRSARLQLEQIDCRELPGDTCFRSRLIDPASVATAAIRFGIAESGDEPAVVWVDFDATTARSGRAPATLRGPPGPTVGATSGRIRPST